MCGASVVQRYIEVGVFCDWNHFYVSKNMNAPCWCDCYYHNIHNLTSPHVLLVIISLTSSSSFSFSFTFLIHLFCYVIDTYKQILQVTNGFGCWTLSSYAFFIPPLLLQFVLLMADNYTLPEPITTLLTTQKFPVQCVFV